MLTQGLSITTSGVHYFQIIQLPVKNYSAYTMVTTPLDIVQMLYFNTFARILLRVGLISLHPFIIYLLVIVGFGSFAGVNSWPGTTLTVHLLENNRTP